MPRRQRRLALIAALIVLLTACSASVATTARSAYAPPAAMPTATAAATSAVAAVAQTTSTTAASASATTGASAWASLAARPLHLPALAPGGACPVTAWHAATSVDPAGSFAPAAGYFAFGKGPIYPIIYNFSPDKVAVRFAKLPDFGRGSKQDKVLWLSRPTYRAPALIRGRQLGGPALLRFGPTDSTPTELRFPLDTGVSSADTASGWRDLPSYMLLPAPGCYAFQVDGMGFSDVIVFKVGP